MTSYVSREEFERMSERLAELEKMMGRQSSLLTIATVSAEAVETQVKESMQQCLRRWTEASRRGDFGAQAYANRRG
ncbi:hypothetical protein ASG25_01995 [Rhizobium sp. Leaf384]|uniref:hypothetical protein n=1 Tax=unclassified Rhizobium TaxID=2613769 RepID=UPI000712AD45|nr:MULTISPECIES: hypothetical protein [unclassified Rhizobium]KQS74211.1 hypothetical protein ASG58_17060 [Rhizobium sp. Leaf383]KQS80406.1 hypothetical protein ASG25_01995 [Rhizobium sp. Leaf384]